MTCRRRVPPWPRRSPQPPQISCRCRGWDSNNKCFAKNRRGWTGAPVFDAPESGVALVNAPKIVLTATQLVFRDQDSDFRLGLSADGEKHWLPLGATFKDVFWTGNYAMTMPDAARLESSSGNSWIAHIRPPIPHCRSKACRRPMPRRLSSSWPSPIEASLDRLRRGSDLRRIRARARRAIGPLPPSLRPGGGARCNWRTATNP